MVPTASPSPHEGLGIPALNSAGWIQLVGCNRKCTIRVIHPCHLVFLIYLQLACPLTVLTQVNQQTWHAQMKMYSAMSILECVSLFKYLSHSCVPSSLYWQHQVSWATHFMIDWLFVSSPRLPLSLSLASLVKRIPLPSITTCVLTKSHRINYFFTCMQLLLLLLVMLVLVMELLLLLLLLFPVLYFYCRCYFILQKSDH